ncbi:YeiH family putative sulfate export transporter [Mannheimia massilioguelmaensis]|uniref:YeiH family putative sulfate export transporter n=1 Tax=Mannheimia massilioguelmaensis TaxID=1604354 RepID=UPI0005C90E42|nr:YeiH family putative sulfate export transporter [Mannheimia massilioguelmaensis]
MKNTFYIGLLFIAILTIIVNLLAQTTFATHLQLSSLTIAIILGIIIGNLFHNQLKPYTADGINFAKGTLLRTAIVLYGFRITLQDINQVGINAISADAVMLITTFLLTCYLGIHYLKIDKHIAYLSAAGCSICGAAAVMATAPITKSESHQISVAVAVVVIFGTLSMLIYPLAYPYLSSWMNAHQFGIYIGSTVHEVAQVYAAGGNISPTVADNAVITKMIRVMMLAPFLLALSWFLNKQDSNNQTRKINIPWFAVYFILIAIFNSFNLLPESVVKFIISLDSLLLIAAMTALGLTTQISAIKQAGFKPILLGAIVYIWLTVGGFMVNLLMQTVM